MTSADPELTVLMLAALDGDSRAYRALLGDLRVRLDGYFRRRLGRDPEEVEDLVQDTLIAIHRRRETFDRAEPVTPWVYAIARYKLIDHYRRRGRRQHVPLEAVETELRAADLTAAADARRDVERALEGLPERTRALLRSLRLDGLSVAETAAAAGMSEGAVKVAAHRGLKTLMNRFAGREGGHD